MADRSQRIIPVAATHGPAVDVQATASLPAPGAGLYAHVTEISATLAVGTAAGGALLVLRDGASGAGTIIRNWRLGIVINGYASIAVSGIDIPGSVNTAMTLEFTAAGPAGSFEAVNIAGYVSNTPAARLPG